ncbi:restriction endonuclease subunit S [Criblamydia sequanensis]|uniref:Type I restriction enzyme, S subunit n=1 Tax=Candidatus Criblamydia sequanensis CRIB-18 TaxID=1437425 RepID=A0A090CYV2_9BACT|nr:restriction endonuclease subunit S [Criblamydia sequanensis]CDR33741.1 Type I restriction enzyme, S subunit [Criblamydia sequanensis CRIB-18]
MASKHTRYPEKNIYSAQLPLHWKKVPLYAIAALKKITNQIDRQLLSVYLNLGVIPFKDVSEKRTNATSEDLSKYQAVDPGDFVLNNQQAWRGSVGVSKFSGIVSPAYIVLSISDELEAKFANYLFRNNTMIDQYVICSKGVGSIQRNLYWPNLKRVLINIPSKQEQQAIVHFLDYKCAQINKFIQKKKRLIELLKEQKQAIINQAVTRGLESNVRLKPSGVEWLGDIPENWKVAPLKRIVAINKSNLSEKTHPFHEFQYVDISAVGSGYLKQKLVSYQFKDAPSRARRIVSSGDILLSTVRTYLRAIWYNESQQNLIASTGFAVLSPGKETLPEFLGYRVQGNDFIDQIVRLSTGIAYPAINETILGSIKLAIPNTIIEQEKIYSHIYENTKNYDVLIARYVKEIHLIQEYRTRLISDMVTGQIDIRNIEVDGIAEEDLIEETLREEQEEESLELIGAGDDD